MSSARQLKLEGDFFIERLSPREREVLVLIGRGLTTAEIAAVLFIAYETVKSHVKHILQKLGAHTRTGAVVIALKRGEIPLADL